MGSEQTSLIRRLLSGVIDLLPDGGIGHEGPAPDIDGRRDTDTDYRRAVLTAKSQMPPSGGHGATSYEPVEPKVRRDRDEAVRAGRGTCKILCSVDLAAA